MNNADLIIDARWMVPVVPRATILESASIAIRDHQIAALGPTSEIHARFRTDQRVTLDHHVLIPGLINAHTHAAMTLLRGRADDIALMAWLKTAIWPAEQRLVSDRFVYDGTLLACAEMLRAGTTCFGDMYFFPEAAIRAALAANMRISAGIIALDFPTAYATDADDYLAKGLATRDAFAGEPLFSGCLAPHAPYTNGDMTLEKVLAYAQELDLPIVMHVAETADEIQQSLVQLSERPVARLARLGLLSPNFVAVHAVHLDEVEIALFARHGCHVVHCPTSNLKLASGIAPVAAMFKAGINVCFGTDGAASNNRLDMLNELRLAALLTKGASGDAEAMPAFAALESATLNAAKALALDDRIGSLEVGKQADLTAIAMDSIETLPCYDVVSHLCYAASRENVTDVWVRGLRVLENRTLPFIDLDALKRSARYWQSKIH